MNVVVLVGRLARDPELRYTNAQLPVCSATIAVDRQPRQGQTRDEAGADFIRLTIFGKQAETFSRYLTKGRQVAIEGRLNTGSYQNQRGETVYTTDVIVNRFDFIGSRGDAPQQGGYGGGSYGGNFGGRSGSSDAPAQTGGYGSPAQGDSFGAQQSYGGDSSMGNNTSANLFDTPDGFEALSEDELPF